MRGNSRVNFPYILRDPIIGEAATNLYADAQRMLERLVAEKWLQGRGSRRIFSRQQRGRRRHRSLRG